MFTWLKETCSSQNPEREMLRPSGIMDDYSTFKSINTDLDPTPSSFSRIAQAVKNKITPAFLFAIGINLVRDLFWGSYTAAGLNVKFEKTNETGYGVDSQAFGQLVWCGVPVVAVCLITLAILAIRECFGKKDGLTINDVIWPTLGTIAAVYPWDIGGATAIEIFKKLGITNSITLNWLGSIGNGVAEGLMQHLVINVAGKYLSDLPSLVARCKTGEFTTNEEGAIATLAQVPATVLLNEFVKLAMSATLGAVPGASWTWAALLSEDVASNEAANILIPGVAIGLTVAFFNILYGLLYAAVNEKTDVKEKNAFKLSKAGLFKSEGSAEDRSSGEETNASLSRPNTKYS